MDKRDKIVLMLDSYRELLTQKQRDVMELYYENDLSLSELSDHTSTSRQACYDLIKRCEKLLIGYEKKLKLVERKLEVEERKSEISQKISDIIADESIDKACYRNLLEINKMIEEI